MSKETIETTCNCGTRISFDQKILSQYKNVDGGKNNQKPIEIESGEIHSCNLRIWSHPIFCRTCSKAIMFNDRIVGPKGGKVPHSASKGNMVPHVCEVVA